MKHKRTLVGPLDESPRGVAPRSLPYHCEKKHDETIKYPKGGYQLSEKLSGLY